MSDGRRRGAQPLSDRDWLFGSRPRRRLLEGVLMNRAGGRKWTRPDLAELAGVVANGGADAHVDGLVRLGLLVPSNAGEWEPAHPRPPLGVALRRVLVGLQGVPAATRPRPATGSSVGAALRAS